jgi:hypothetical protein
VFAKVLHTIQQNWFQWLVETGLRLIPITFFVQVVKVSIFNKLPCPNLDIF